MDGDAGIGAEEHSALGKRHRMTEHVTYGVESGVGRPKQAELRRNDRFGDCDDALGSINGIMAGLYGAENGMLDGHDAAIGSASGDGGRDVPEIMQGHQVGVSAPQLAGSFLAKGAQLLLKRDSKGWHRV